LIRRRRRRAAASTQRIRYVNSQPVSMLSA